MQHGAIGAGDLRDREHSRLEPGMVAPFWRELLDRRDEALVRVPRSAGGAEAARDLRERVCTRGRRGGLAGTCPRLFGGAALRQDPQRWRRHLRRHRHGIGAYQAQAHLVGARRRRGRRGERESHVADEPAGRADGLSLACKPRVVRKRDGRLGVRLSVMAAAVFEDVRRRVGRPAALAVGAAPVDEPRAPFLQLVRRELRGDELGEAAVEELELVVTKQEPPKRPQSLVNIAPATLQRSGQLVLRDAAVGDREDREQLPGQVAELGLVEPAHLVAEVVLGVDGRVALEALELVRAVLAPDGFADESCEQRLAVCEGKDARRRRRRVLDVVPAHQEAHVLLGERPQVERRRGTQRVLNADGTARVWHRPRRDDDVDVVAHGTGKRIGDRDRLVGHLVEPIDEQQQRP